MSQEPTDPQTDPGTTGTDRRDTTDHGANRWLSGIAALVGLWIAVSPFVYDVTEMAMWNNLVVGAAILLLAGYNFYRLSDGHRINVGAAGLVALLGLWLIAAPFLIEVGSDAFGWSTLVSGAIVAVLSGYNAYRGSTDDTTTATGTRT